MKPTLKARINAFRHPEARTHVVNPEGRLGITLGLAGASALRRRVSTVHNVDPTPKRGMWVMHEAEQRVGILTDLQPGDIATVMLTAEDGTNLLQVERPASEFRQATFAEIPNPRKPSVDVARRPGDLA